MSVLRDTAAFRLSNVKFDQYLRRIILVTTKTGESDMSEPTQKNDETTQATDAHQADTGLSNLLRLSVVGMDAVAAMNVELIEFMGERIREDFKTQHDILQCKSLEELQHVQAQFFQTAMDQYHDEAGKLVELGSNALEPDSAD